MTDQSQPRPGTVRPPAISLPGEKIEEAAAEVTTEAGKSLIRGVGRLFGAGVATWIATRETKAKAAAMAIETEAEIKRDRALMSERRNVELEELDHQALLERRLNRLRHELAREQDNLEAIANKSLELLERNPNADKAREIDEDWMFAFAKFAQAVSDKEVQELWARILSSAALADGRKLSAGTLQAMSLLDAKSGEDFRKLCAAVATFTFFPAHDRVFEPGSETQNIDVLTLKELGLIQEDPLSGAYAFVDFLMRIGPLQGARIGLLHTGFSLTRRGSEIANVVFRAAAVELSEDLEQKYLRDVIANQIHQYHWVVIAPPPRPREVIAPYAVQLLYPRGPTPVRADLSAIETQFSGRLKRLLEWASTRYDLELTSNVPPPGAIGHAS
jgi:hypothetical protein